MTKLTNIIFEGTGSFKVYLKSNIRPGIGHLKMKSATKAQLRLLNTNFSQEFEFFKDPLFRKQIGQREDTQIWKVSRIPSKESEDTNKSEDTKTKDNCYRFEYFNCPYVKDWRDELPIFVPPSLMDLWKKSINNSSLESQFIFEQKYIVCGMPLIAVLDNEDEHTITLWSNSANAYVFIVYPAFLELKKIISHLDVKEHVYKPNVFLNVLPNLQFKEIDKPLQIPGFLETIIPERSFVMATWSKYLAIKRQRDEERFLSRSQYPLSFYRAIEKNGQWIASIRSNPETNEAWLGPKIETSKWNKVGQSVILSDDHNIKATIESIQKKSETELDVKLSLPQGRFPNQGTLTAVEDKGSSTQSERELNALTRLARGLARQPRLLEILNVPAHANPPKDNRLPKLSDKVLANQKFPPDASQNAAIQAMFNCRDIVAVQGPPGTGKTRIIVQLLYYLSEEAVRRKRPLKVLVSSVQNEAVIGIVERLIGDSSLTVHYYDRKSNSEEQDLNWQDIQNDFHQKAVRRIEERLKNRYLQEEEQKLLKLKQQLHVFIAQYFTIRKEELSNKEAFFAQLDAFIQEGPFHSEQKSTVKKWIEGEKEQTTDDMSLDDLPVEPLEVLDWWEHNRPNVPAAFTAKMMMGIRQLKRAIDRQRSSDIDSIMANIRNIFNQCQPKRTQVEETSKDFVEICSGDLLPHIRYLLDKLYKTEAGIALQFLRHIKDRDIFNILLRKYSTTTAATTSRSGKHPDDYDWVIIDEAGRAAPLELFIPMVQGEKIILIGDHRQLPPMVEKEVWDKIEDRKTHTRVEDINIFSDFFNHLPPASTCRLETQYRSHKDIVELVNAIYYAPHEENIRPFFNDTEAISEDFPFDWRVNASSKQSVLFKTVPINSFNREAVYWDEVESHGCTEENTAEVNRIEVVLHGLYDKIDAFRKRLSQAQKKLQEQYHQYTNQPIAVIVPYSKQKALVREMFRRNPRFDQIAQIKTIDKVQGREYPIVIMSLVRSDGRAGFLASPNRMNVALSRAQHQVILVGHKKSFMQCHKAKEVVELVKYISNKDKK